MFGFRAILRRNLRSPVFSLTVVSVLGVALAANTLVFTILSSILLRPLPFAEPDRLVTISETRSGATAGGLTSLPVFDSWRARQTGVHVAAYTQTDGVLTGAEPLRLEIAAASGDLFEVLGVPLFLGTGFSHDDDRFGAARTLILSFSLWRSRFNSDRDVVNRHVVIDRQTYAVAGVAAPTFDFPNGTDAWTPLRTVIPPDYSRVATYKFLNVIGRLGQSESLSQAQSALSTIAAAVPQNSDWSARMVTMRDAVTGNVRLPLVILMAAVAIVLLIACANVGNLMLARGAGRAAEFAVRTALGASRGRLAVESLVECGLLATAAGAIGLGAAWSSLGLVLKLAPFDLPRLAEVHIDLRVFGFAAATVLLSTIVSGWVPMLRVVPADLSGALRSGARTGSGGSRPRFRAAVVVAEIALTLVLVTTAGLLIRSFAALLAVDPGYRTTHVAAYEIKPAFYKYQWPAWGNFFSDLTRRARALPGVSAVSTATALPLSGGVPSVPIVVEGREAKPTNAASLVAAVSPGYFAALGIPIDSGRDFTDADGTGKTAVTIVSETFARTFFPNERVIGRRVRPFFGGPTLREIVAVVHDVRQDKLGAEPAPMMYNLAAQQASGPLFLVIRSSVPPSQLTIGVRNILHDIDPDQPIGSVTTMTDLVSRSIALPRSYAVILGTLSSVALLLAVAGIYALLSEYLAQHRHEFAIRLALGATPSDIVRIFLDQGLGLALTGIGVGVAVSIPAVRVTAALLYGVGPFDAWTFIAAIATVTAVAIAAVVGNAWRAGRIDLPTSLRT